MPPITLYEIQALVELQLGKQNIKANDRLVEDLRAESADIANLVTAAEEKFGVFIKESEIARIFTPLDLFEIIQKRLNES